MPLLRLVLLASILGWLLATTAHAASSSQGSSQNGWQAITGWIPDSPYKPLIQAAIVAALSGLGAIVFTPLKEVIASWWKQKVSGLVASPPRQPTRHNLPPLEQERSRFIGRDRELDTLGQWLRQPGDPIVIWGMVGVGKSSLVLQALHPQLKRLYWQAICHLDARQGWEGMAQQVVRFATIQLGLDLEGSPAHKDDLAGRLAWCWQHWPEPPAPVLLVLDGLSDAAADGRLATGLPDRFQRLISCRQRIDVAGRSIELEPLDPAQGRLLLEVASGRGPFDAVDRVAADAIVKAVGRLPYSLTRLGALLKKDPDEDLERLRQRLLRQSPASGAARALAGGRSPGVLERRLAATLNLSVERLSPAALELALTLGQLAPTLVPWPLAVSCAPAEMNAEEWDQARLDLLAERLLERLGDKRYRLHPVVHEVMAQQASTAAAAHRSRQLRLARSLVHHLLALNIGQQPERQEALLELLPHLHATWMEPEQAPFDPSDAAWMVRVGRGFAFQGDVHRAILWLRAALEQVERTPDQAGRDPELRPRCLEALASVEWELDELDSAETHYRQLLRLWEPALDGNPQGEPSCEDGSLELADALNGLGMTLQQRDPAAAETLLRRALAIRRRCLAAGEEPLLTSLNNLGQLLMHQGQQQAARALFEEGLSSASKPAARGSETHQPNARVLAYLAFHCGQLDLASNQLQEAVKQFRRAVAFAEQGLGAHHPDWGGMVKELAYAEAQLGHLEVAMEHCQSALACMQGALGDGDDRSEACRLLLESIEQHSLQAKRRWPGWLFPLEVIRSRRSRNSGPS